MGIPDTLKNLRAKHNYMQKDVADYLGISKSAYGYYEQGRNEMDIRSIVMLSELYNVSTDYLLGKTSIEEQTLSEDAQQLLTMYNSLSENDKAFFKGFLFAKANSVEALNLDNAQKPIPALDEVLARADAKRRDNNTFVQAQIKVNER